MKIILTSSKLTREIRSPHITSNLNPNTGTVLNHTHANLNTLNNIGVINGTLFFNGEAVDDKTILLSQESW